MFTRGNVSTLFVIEIIVIRIALYVIVRGGIRPMDTNLNVVIVKCYEREGTLRSFTEEETERIEVRTSAYTRMRSVRTLRNVLGERIDSNLLRENGILCIYEGATDVEFNVVNDCIPSLNI